jgi:hypothetical protein
MNPDSPIKPSTTWSELYDLESRLAAKTKVKQDRRGHPASTFIRRRKTLTLTDEELAYLDQVAFQIREALRPGTVTQSQVYGLAVRLLKERSRFIPAHADSWGQIVQALQEGEKRE